MLILGSPFQPPHSSVCLGITLTREMETEAVEPWSEPPCHILKFEENKSASSHFVGLISCAVCVLGQLLMNETSKTVLT